MSDNGQDAVVVAEPAAADEAALVVLPESTAKKRDHSLVATSSRAWMDTARFDQGYRVANAMAAGCLVPKHLRGATHLETAANCMRIVMLADGWKMDPWAVMSVSFMMNDKLGFEGKLIMAVINTRAPLSKRLSFAFTGDGQGRTITVSATFNGETEPRTLSGSLRDWFKKTCHMWSGPRVSVDQKLTYTGSLWWARRHWPEGVLGIAIREELEHPMVAERSPTEDGPATMADPLGDMIRDLEDAGIDDAEGTLQALAAGLVDWEAPTEGQGMEMLRAKVRQLVDHAQETAP